MEESQEILLNSLANWGVPIPPGLSSIRDLTPTTLVSICSQSLRLIDDTSSFPMSLPDSMTDRFKICTEIASAVKNLGYIGDMNFHKFLYPSEEDMHKLVRFMVERLSESSEARKSAAKKDVNNSVIREEDDFKITPKDCMQNTNNQEVHMHNEEVGNRLKELRLNTDVSKSEDVFVSEYKKSDLIPQKMKQVSPLDIYGAGTRDSIKEELSSVENGKGSIQGFEDSRNNAAGNEETVSQGDGGQVSEVECKQTSPQEHQSKMRDETDKLRIQEKMLMEEVTAKSAELQHLEEEHELLKAAVEMALDDQHPVDFYIMQLSEQVDARRHNLVELESQWEELSKLSTDLDKQPKLASRGSYIQRIKEITKNSRKQDTDIERILKETRELQLESNSIQERLHRTYAVVDETVFREAKKDPVGRQAYRLLTSIHESFEEISEKILATDRTRREAVDHEAKLAAMASRSLNIDKLQADLDAIRKENEFLEQHLHNT